MPGCFLTFQLLACVLNCPHTYNRLMKTSHSCSPAIAGLRFIVQLGHGFSFILPVHVALTLNVVYRLHMSWPGIWRAPDGLSPPDIGEPATLPDKEERYYWSH